MLPILIVLGDNMTDIQYCYITEQYYIDNPMLIKILDIGNPSKHNVRTHMCLNIQFNNNSVLIPLIKNLGEPNRKFGKIGFSVPSQSKPKAGLDYRYIMIINNVSYIRFDTPKISNSQIKIIENNYGTIEKEAIEYIQSYIRVSNKGRVDRTARFRESSLINFHKELNIICDNKDTN